VFLQNGEVNGALAPTGEELPALVSVSFQDADTLNATFSCSNFEFIPDGHGNELVVGEGFTASGDSGNPQLPIAIVRLGLPPDANLESLNLDVVASPFVELAGAHNIAPVPAAVADVDGGIIVEWGDDKTIENGRNVFVYEQDAFYGGPPIVLLGAEEMRQWKIATLAYSPFQYNPVSGAVRVADDVEIRLSYELDDPPGGELLADESEIIEPSDLLANYSDVSPYYLSEGASVIESEDSITDTGDYLIITTAAIRNNSTQLASFVLTLPE